MLLDDATTRYLERLIPAEDEALADARRRADELGADPVTPAVGALLRWLAALGPARDVVEIGGGTGVSALWLLGGMHGRGMLSSIESDPERQRAAQQALARAGSANRVRTMLGAADTVLPRLADASYDLVLIDTAPTTYPAHLAHARRLLRPGGLLVADDVLLGGRVADADDDGDDVKAMRAFTVDVTDDQRLRAQVLPVGGGVLVAHRTA